MRVKRGAGHLDQGQGAAEKPFVDGLRRDDEFEQPLELVLVDAPGVQLGVAALAGEEVVDVEAAHMGVLEVGEVF